MRYELTILYDATKSTIEGKYIPLVFPLYGIPDVSHNRMLFILSMSDLAGTIEGTRPNYQFCLTFFPLVVGEISVCFS